MRASTGTATGPAKRRSPRAGRGALAGLALSGLLAVLAGCGGGTANETRPGAAQAAGQQIQLAYQDQVAENRAKLTAGRIDLDGPKAPEVGTTYQVRATICGPYAPGCGPIKSPSPAPSAGASAGPSASPDPAGHVMTGARIRVRMSSQLPGTLTPISNPVQPVVADDDVAKWFWDVRADKPGPYTLTFVVSTLAGDTEENLLPDQVFTMSFPVQSTSSYWWESTGATAWQLLLGLAGLLSAFGVSILGVVKWLRRRYHDRAAKAGAIVSGPATAAVADQRPLAGMIE